MAVVLDARQEPVMVIHKQSQTPNMMSFPCDQAKPVPFEWLSRNQIAAIKQPCFIMLFYLIVRTTSSTDRKPTLDAQCLLPNSEGDVEEKDAPVLVHDCDYIYSAIDLPGADYHNGVKLVAGVPDENGASCEIVKCANESEGMFMSEHLMEYIVEVVQRAMWSQEVILQWIPRIEEEQLECAFIQFGADEYVWWEMVEVEIADEKYLIISKA